FLVKAGDEIAFAARGTREVVTAMPADAHPLAFFPICYAGAELVHDAGDFMAGNTRILNAREDAVLCEVVAEANAAGLHFDADLARTGLGNIALDNFKIAAGFRNLDCFHFHHETLPFEGGLTAISMHD